MSKMDKLGNKLEMLYDVMTAISSDLDHCDKYMRDSMYIDAFESLDVAHDTLCALMEEVEEMMYEEESCSAEPHEGECKGSCSSSCGNCGGACGHDDKPERPLYEVCFDCPYKDTDACLECQIW